MTDFFDPLYDAIEPVAMPLGLSVCALLLIILIVAVVWPLCPEPVDDPMARSFGDLPRRPS